MNKMNIGRHNRWSIKMELFGLEDGGSGSMEVPTLGRNIVEG